jgi:hypothetical protein
MAAKKKAKSRSGKKTTSRKPRAKSSPRKALRRAMSTAENVVGKVARGMDTAAKIAKGVDEAITGAKGKGSRKGSGRKSGRSGSDE